MASPIPYRPAPLTQRVLSRRQAYSRHAFPSHPTTNHWHRLGSDRPQPAGSKLAAHHRLAHADCRLHPGIPRLLAKQRIYHRPLTVQDTGVVLPQPNIEFQLLASKTDPFRRGATITIGVSSGPCCPVSLLARYLDATRRSSNLPADTPLFKFTSGTPLTRAVFTQHIQRALTETGFANSSRFMSHSFRIGVTTTAAEVGVPAGLIKTMGRWSSDAHQQYIQTPLATQLAVAQQLTPLRRSEPLASTSTQSRPSPDTQPHS